MSNDTVTEYYALADQGVAFEDPRLARLREQMTDAELMRVLTMLKNAAAAARKEEARLRARLRARLGVNDNAAKR